MSKKKHIATVSNEEDPYEALDETHRIAVDMRIENYAYADIAKTTKVTEQSARRWFMRGGICDAAYQQKREIRRAEREERFKEIDSQLQEMASDAIIVFKMALKKGSESAAARVLELAGYMPIPTKPPQADPNRPVFYIPENGRDPQPDH